MPLINVFLPFRITTKRRRISPVLTGDMKSMLRSDTHRDRLAS